MPAIVASSKYSTGKYLDRRLRKTRRRHAEQPAFQQTLETLTSEYGPMSSVTVRKRVGIPVRFVGCIQ